MSSEKSQSLVESKRGGEKQKLLKKYYGILKNYQRVRNNAELRRQLSSKDRHELDKEFWQTCQELIAVAVSEHSRQAIEGLNKLLCFGENDGFNSLKLSGVSREMLRAAAMRGDEKSIEYIIENVLQQIKHENSEQDIARIMWLSVSHGGLSVLDHFLKKQEVEFKTLSDDTRQGILFEGVRISDLELLKFLEDKDVDFHAVHHLYENLNPLQVAARYSTVKIIIYLIEKQKMNMRIKTKRGETLLHLAVGDKNLEAVKYFFGKHNFDIHAETVHRQTSLVRALKLDDESAAVADEFLRYGAQIKREHLEGIIYCIQPNILKNFIRSGAEIDQKMWGMILPRQEISKLLYASGIPAKPDFHLGDFKRGLPVYSEDYIKPLKERHKTEINELAAEILPKVLAEIVLNYLDDKDYLQYAKNYKKTILKKLLGDDDLFSENYAFSNVMVYQPYHFELKKFIESLKKSPLLYDQLIDSIAHWLQNYISRLNVPVEASNYFYEQQWKVFKELLGDSRVEQIYQQGMRQRADDKLKWEDSKKETSESKNPAALINSRDILMLIGSIKTKSESDVELVESITKELASSIDLEDILAFIESVAPQRKGDKGIEAEEAVEVREEVKRPTGVYSFFSGSQTFSSSASTLAPPADAPAPPQQPAQPEETRTLEGLRAVLQNAYRLLKRDISDINDLESFKDIQEFYRNEGEKLLTDLNKELKRKQLSKRLAAADGKRVIELQQTLNNFAQFKNLDPLVVMENERDGKRLVSNPRGLVGS